MSFFIPAAMAQETAAASPPGGDFTVLIFAAGMFVFMYFFIIRPQRKRQKEHQNLVTGIAKGDEVVMTSGMLGKVSKVDDDYLILDVGNNIELKFQKLAVHAVLPKGTVKQI